MSRLTCCVALVALLGACAHAGTHRHDGAPEAAAGAEQPVRLLVTGSRIPRYVVPGSSVLLSDGPLRVYERDAILATGRDGDLPAALRALDPAVTIGR